ncbi:MAG: hypothetical protein WDN08_18815 [Rhizomicrobium sp.]
MAFMLDWVPEPVCHTESGKWTSSWPIYHLLRRLDDGLAELGIEKAQRHVGLGGGALDDAERADDRNRPASPSRSLKLCRLRSACAPQYFEASTSMGPKVSVSVRVVLVHGETIRDGQLFQGSISGTPECPNP